MHRNASEGGRRPGTCRAERIGRIEALRVVCCTHLGRGAHALFDGHLVSVFLDGEEILTDLILADLQQRLPSDRFERVHRRALVNLSRAVRLVPQPTGGYLACTDTGAEVPVSRGAARDLRRR